MLSENRPDHTWSVQEQLSYYINAYNANTVKLVLDNYPLKSVQSIDGATTKEFVSMGTKQISLGALENSILRRMEASNHQIDGRMRSKFLVYKSKQRCG